MKKSEKPVSEKKQITNLEVLELHAKLSNLRSVSGIKLNYAIQRTLHHLKPVVEALGQDKVIPKKPGFIAYENELKDQYKKLSAGEDGAPRTRVTMTQMGEVEQLDLDLNAEPVKTARAAVQFQYAEAIEERKKQVEDYNKFLLEPCAEELKLYPVRIEDMPATEKENTRELWDAVEMLFEE